MICTSSRAACSRRLFLLCLTSALPASAAPTSPAPSEVTLRVPMLEVRAWNPGADIKPILRVTLRGGAVVDLPMSADTWTWNGSDKSRASERTLMLRDARFGQALLKPDLSALPPNADIESAEMRLFSTYREREGDAKLQLHRVLTPWTEDATVVAPSPQGAPWNGLKAGVDYEAAPAATWSETAFVKGQNIVLGGLETLVRGWQSKKFPNNGLLLTMSGKSLQVGVASREAQAPQPKAALAVGGPDDGKLLLSFSPSLVQRAALRPGDVRSATLSLHVRPIKNVAGATVSLHRVAASNRDFEAQPFVKARLAEDGSARLPLPLALLAGSEPVSLVAKLDAAGARPLLTLATGDAKTRPALEVTLAHHPGAMLFPNGVEPRAGVYTTLRDGHFDYGGQRLRLWGVVGYGDPSRLRKMGFNAQRVWNPTSQTSGGTSNTGQGEFYTVESARRGVPAPFQKGDGSKLDVADKHFAALKSNGMFVMFAALTGIMPVEPLLDDGSFIAGGPGWPEWKAAMQGAKNKADVARYAIYFDKRLQKMKLQHAANLLNHLNPYTGRKYGEDEAIAVYEMWNEQGFMKRALESGFEWPAYFANQAQAQWNDWLRARYRDDNGLRAAWGNLKEGESLTANSIKMAPLVRERADYPRVRASDYVRFLDDKEAAFHREFVDFCRSQARRGVGVNVAPFSFDTQYKPSIQWPHSKARGEVNSFGMYFWDLASQLDRAPAMYVIDANRVQNRASVLYETNAGRPGPYRAEYPLRLAALASWQDFDGVFFHYWQAGDLKSDEEFLLKPLTYQNPNFFWTAAHNEADQPMTSSIALAGRIFLSGAIRPAPSPQTIRVGRDGIYSFDLTSGVDARTAAFSRGAQIRFEPDAPFKTIIEGEAPPQTPGHVRAGDEILWDYANGRLIVDTPTAKIYVGKTTASHRFRDGITLSGFSSSFIAWALVSSDGKPLVGANATRRAFVTGQFDARNTGFDIDWSVVGGPVQQAKAIKSAGAAPVLVDKVDFSVSFPTRLDLSFTPYDFALRAAAPQSVRDSNLLRVRPGEREIWMGVLDFSRRGQAATPLVDANTLRPTLASRNTAIASPGDARLAQVLNPLPNLSWGDSYSQAHRTIRDGAWTKTSVSPEDTGSAGDKSILIGETEVLLSQPSDIEVRFAGGAMRSISATFKRPPDLREAARALRASLGEPVEERIVGDQTREDRVRWVVKSTPANVEVTLAESQGIVTLSYVLQRS